VWIREGGEVLTTPTTGDLRDNSLSLKSGKGREKLTQQNSRGKEYVAGGE